MPERKVPVIAGGTLAGFGRWTLDENGLLDITGFGDMGDFHYDPYARYPNKYTANYTTPWWKHHDQIRSVNISWGITSIGSYAFYGCNNLVNITIPRSVSSIYRHAFGDCKALRTIVIPKTVTYIDSTALKGCNNLRNVVMPEKFKHPFFEFEFGIYRGFVEFIDA